MEEDTICFHEQESFKASDNIVINIDEVIETEVIETIYDTNISNEDGSHPIAKTIIKKSKKKHTEDKNEIKNNIVSVSTDASIQHKKNVKETVKEQYDSKTYVAKFFKILCCLAIIAAILVFRKDIMKFIYKF